MLVKIGSRLINESDIECIEPSNYTDRNGLTQYSITVIMKNGNKYQHRANKPILSSDIHPIDKIYNYIEEKKKKGNK